MKTPIFSLAMISLILSGSTDVFAQPVYDHYDSESRRYEEYRRQESYRSSDEDYDSSESSRGGGCSVAHAHLFDIDVPARARVVYNVVIEAVDSQGRTVAELFRDDGVLFQVASRYTIEGLELALPHRNETQVRVRMLDAHTGRVEAVQNLSI